MKILDYSTFNRYLKTYSGSEGKMSIMIDDSVYMIKGPTKAKENRGALEGTWYNNVFSEYIGSHIFAMTGIPTQETKLGYYDKQLVVLCKDFTQKGERLQEFSEYKNGFLDSNSLGRTVELPEVLETIEKNDAIPQTLKKEAIERFWDMFVIDALIGNPDRHNGNWGFLFNQDNNKVRLAPVYDCGASLFARMADKIKTEILSNETELNQRIYNRPLSAITLNGQKLNYNVYLKETDNEDCKAAIKRIVPKIDVVAIKNMINEIPVLSDLNKRFYSVIIDGKYNKVLQPAYKQILKQEVKKDRTIYSKIFGCELKNAEYDPDWEPAKAERNKESDPPTTSKNHDDFEPEL